MKKINQVTTPHDAFVKSYLSTPEECKAFICAHFEPSITKHIIKVELTNKSFVKRTLRQIHSDLVFKLQMDDGKLGYVYVLCEHQSVPHKLTLLRVFEYTIELIQTHMKMHPEEEKWPLVLTGCLYHGTQSPYPYPTVVYDYFQNPALAEKIGLFREFQLIDLTVIDDKTLEKHQGIALMEKILKYIRKKNLTLLKLEELLATEVASGRIRISDVFKLKIVLEYLLHALSGEEYSEEEILNLFQDKLKEKDMITVAQKMRQEARQEGIQQGMQRGRQEGIQQGMQKGVKQTAGKLLEQGVPIEVIASATGLSRGEIKKLPKN